MQHNVIIVEDDRLIRQSFIRLLSSEKAKVRNINLIGSASNEETLFKLLKTALPDVILLDMGLDYVKNAGIHILDKINKTIKVLILSADVNNANLITEAMNKGAKGFLGKDIDEDTLLQRIVDVSKGKDNITCCKVGSTLLQQRTKTKKLDHLTIREIQVFKLSAAGFNRKQIAQGLCIGLAAVDTHKRHIREKTNLSKPVHYLLWVLRNKIEWLPDILNLNNEISL
jgi:Response regulator containing a CheY-like receiver domain and an HTH DNA-binding domain